MKKYNVGIIGYGWAATAHIDAINASKQAQVTAIYSSRPLDSAELSAKHGSPIVAYQDLDAMLANPDIHVVDITSYPSQHRNQAVAAANAKKHIILEKPMANSLQEVREIVAAAKSNGVKGCVCFECRFSGQFQSTKAILDEGLLGEVHYGEVDYYHGIGPWYGQFRWNIGKKDGGSALLTAGCHALDALLMVMPGEVESVTSQSIRPVLGQPRLLTGNDLVAIFGLAPGPLFREIFDDLEKAQVEGKVRTRNEAESFVRSYLQNV